MNRPLIAILTYVVLFQTAGTNFLFAAAPQGTAFTYQGQLLKDGVAVNDTCDFDFGLFEDSGGASQVGATQTVIGVTVVDGFFTVELNGLNEFGPTAFNGEERYLEIAVQCPPDVGFTPLSPLQPITAAPYAQALPGLYTEQNTTSPNLIGGFNGNTVSAGGIGATIGGGGSIDNQNRVTDDFGTVGGGSFNQAGDGSGTTDDATLATVSGGIKNTAAGQASTVGGGDRNFASGVRSTVGGGTFNAALGSKSTVSGGDDNTASGGESTVGGGFSNTASGFRSTVGGGDDNIASSDESTVSGGKSNTASGFRSTVGGGDDNTASGILSTVSGGENNTAAGDYSFAAGRRAMANHDGSFVWADSDNNSPKGTNFISTGPDQFLIRATGGVGIGTTAPAADLHIRGVDSLGSILVTPGLSQSSSQLFLTEQQSTSFGMIMRYDGAANQLHFVAQQSGVETAPLVSIDRSTAGNVGIGTTSPGFKLEVNGSAGKPGGGSWSSSSDRRLKKNIAGLQDSLDKLMQLRGVTYEYIDPESINELAGQRIGVIAQEVERVFPDWVDPRSDGYKVVTFRGFEALTVEALRELRSEKDAQIKSQAKRVAKIERENTKLRAENDRLAARLDSLEQLVEQLTTNQAEQMK